MIHRAIETRPEGGAGETKQKLSIQQALIGIAIFGSISLLSKLIGPEN